MKIEFYNVGDEEGKKIKEFLTKNNLPFNEIITDDVNLLDKVRQARISTKVSLLRIFYSSSIHIIGGYNELALNQLIEHIEKYKLKMRH